MKPKRLVLSIFLLLGLVIIPAAKASLAATVSNEETQEEVYQDELAMTEGSYIYYDCQLFENADYYLRYIRLYAGQHTIAGKVNLSVQRRDGEYQRLHVEYVTRSTGWEILESHLYVGTEPPEKMAPGKFPYQQETPSGLTQHEYLIDLEDIGSSFETVYIAVHAVVQKVITSLECSDPVPVIIEETAWGFKTHPKFYPETEPGDIVNPYGDPWGTIFPKGKKKWPAYIMVYIPYNVSDPLYECPQPLLMTFIF